MNKRNKGLGRSLDALLGQSREFADKPYAMDTGNSQESSELRHLPIEKLVPGRFQPRKDMSSEGLDELAASIRSQGVIQPIVVRPINNDQYEIVAGERRWRASQRAGLDKVPCLVKELEDNATIAIALIENIQREDLNALEEAQALERLLNEFGLTHAQVAEAVGKSRTTVTNILRLNQLNDDVKTLLTNSDIDMGHARALLAIDGEQQSELARKVVEGELTVRQTEALVKRELENKSNQPKQKNSVIDPDVERLKVRLSEQLGTAVNIQHNAKGKGQVSIAFSNLNHLDELLRHFDLGSQD